MMWKWIKENAQAMTVTILGIGLLVTVFGLLPNMFFWTVESEVNGQILAKVQPKLVTLHERSSRHEVHIENINKNLQEIKTDLKNMDRKFTTQFEKMDRKFTSLHDILIPMRDAILDLKRKEDEK